MTAESSQAGEAAMRLPDGDVPLNQPFEIEISMCLTEGTPIERFTLNAVMPAHQHGMNYQPVITQSGNGNYTIDGLVFHMQGVWRLTVSALEAGEARSFFIDLTIR